MENGHSFPGQSRITIHYHQLSQKQLLFLFAFKINKIFKERKKKARFLTCTETVQALTIEKYMVSCNILLQSNLPANLHTLGIHIKNAHNFQYIFYKKDCTINLINCQGCNVCLLADLVV